jgi:hypothetical protein
MMSQNRNRKLEQDVILQFSNELQRHFLYQQQLLNSAHSSYAGSALGGQDRELADYLLSVNARFALIEFKADESSIASEISKPLRIGLCSQLASDSAMRARAQEMHFIAWGKLEDDGASEIDEFLKVRKIVLARYAERVCLHCNGTLKVVDSEKFITSFLKYKTKGGSGSRFKRYLEDLFALADKGAADSFAEFQGTVYVYMPSSDSRVRKIVTIPFMGLQHLFSLTTDTQIEKSRKGKAKLNQDRGPTMQR